MAARAREFVERSHPIRLTDPSSDEWTKGRERLEALLHLNVSVLRDPLALLSVLAPLATSALAVLIPGLPAPS